MILDTIILLYYYIIIIFLLSNKIEYRNYKDISNIKYSIEIIN